MKINWSLRLKNRPWLMALLAAAVAFLFDVLPLMGITPPVGEDTVLNALSAILTLLAGLGVIMDPTTPGLTDAPDVLDEPPGRNP